MIKKVNTKLLGINRVLFVLLFILIIIFSSILFSVINYFIGFEALPRKKENNDLVFFLKVLVLAPIVETFFLQFLPIEFLKLFKIKNVLIILITGILFGVLHYFNNGYFRDVFIISFIGFCFAYSFLLAKNRKDMNAFFIVTLIHFGYNLFVYLIKVIV